MITGMNHTGYIVRDLDAAVEFYRDVMGLTLVYSVERVGGPIAQVVGYENAHLKGAFFSAGSGHILELLQYVHPVGSERPSNERNTLGAAHLAFTVENVGQMSERLASRGVRILNPPVEIVPGRKACYLQDPEGNWLELIETND